MAKSEKKKTTWKAVWNIILGIVAIASLIVAYSQLDQQKRDSVSQDKAQSTLIALQQAQLATKTSNSQDYTYYDIDSETDSWGSDGYLNIVSTSVALFADGRISFTITLEGDIPTRPSKFLAYGIWLDTDKNIETGSTHNFTNDLGVDYQLWVSYEIHKWKAQLDRTTISEIKEWSSTDVEFKITGNIITITCDTSLFGSPTHFSWMAYTFKGAGYFDLAPNAGHFSVP